MATPVLLRTPAQRAAADLRRRGILAKAVRRDAVYVYQADPDMVPGLRLMVPSLCNLSIQMPVDRRKKRATSRHA